MNEDAFVTAFTTKYAEAVSIMAKPGRPIRKEQLWQLALATIEWAELATGYSFNAAKRPGLARRIAARLADVLSQHRLLAMGEGASSTPPWLRPEMPL